MNMIKLLIALIVCLNWPGISYLTEFEYNICKVDVVHTPLTPIELGEALRTGHYEKFGTYPNDKRLAVGWAQVALESGQGHYAYNYNFGNIKSNRSYLHYIKRHRFRAYRNAIEGTKDYWNVINRMCKESLAAFDAGAPEYAANVLSRCGYFDCDKAQYSQEMRKLYHYALIHVIPNLSKKLPQ